MTSFEVNTDVALIDPDWDVFQEEHERRFGLAISYVKSIVQGQSFDNAVMNVRVGEHGFYVQSKNFPAAFFGDTGSSTVELVSEEDARAVVFEAVAAYRAGDATSLTCVYSEANPGDVFFGYRLSEEERYELGFLRTGVPLHLRVMLESETDNELLSEKSGVLIYQQLEGQHLLIKAPGRRQPFLLLEGIED